MTVTNREISATLSRYLVAHPGERGALAPLLSCLTANADVSSRQTVPGHVTCSAAVISEAGRVLVIRHNFLDRWLLPGGHIDPVDAGLLAAAQRELAEETGLRGPRAVVAPELEQLPIDIDVHQIPANPAKGEPAHWHADFRYAFHAAEPAVHLQLDEVSGYAWRLPSSLHPASLAAKLSRFALC